MNEVSGKDATAVVNRAIAMPVKLTCDDGKRVPYSKMESVSIKRIT